MNNLPENQNLNYQTQVDNPPQNQEAGENNLVAVLKSHKKTVFLLLSVILAGEIIWAIFFISSSASKNKALNNISITPIVKEKIAKMYFQPAEVTAKVNTPFTIDLMVDTQNRQVDGIDAVILYEPAVLTVSDSDSELSGTQVGNGDLFSSFLVNSVDAVNGKIAVTGSRISLSTEPVSGNAVFARITFTPKQLGETRISILFEPGKTNTSNITESKTSANILTETGGVKVNVEN